MMREDNQLEQVDCKVEIEFKKVIIIYSGGYQIADEKQAPDTGNMFEDPPILSMYLSACMQDKSEGYVHIIQSPRIILDRYFGYASDKGAPEWTRSTCKTDRFQSPTAAFADFFLKVASNKHNKHQPGLLQRAGQWVKSAKLGEFDLVQAIDAKDEEFTVELQSAKAEEDQHQEPWYANLRHGHREKHKSLT